MYIIKRNNKRFNNKVFKTYEEARSYVRKWLRKQAVFNREYKYSNPSISDFNFSVTAR